VTDSLAAIDEQGGRARRDRVEFGVPRLREQESEMLPGIDPAPEHVATARTDDDGAYAFPLPVIGR
jgi:hypothetical protein